MSETTTDPALALACGLARQFEGCVLHPYQDPGGIWTIGYGATWLLDGSEVTADTAPITQAQADAMLEKQMADFLRDVDGLVTVPLNPNQAGALADFAFNLGAGALAQSTLLRLLNAGDYAGAAGQFPLWVHQGDQVLPGLVRRRRAERYLFEKPWHDTDPA